MFKSANVGSADRAVRLILGAILIIVPFISGMQSGLLSWLLPVVGLVLIVTALVRFCPAYHLIGARTCPAPKLSE